jgi:hypothetical protein
VKWQDVLFLDVEDIERFHAEVLSQDGGMPGVRDRGLLESAVMTPRQGYYSTLRRRASGLHAASCERSPAPPRVGQGIRLRPTAV